MKDLTKQNYEYWLNNLEKNNPLYKELINIKNEEEINDRFYKDLDFGTGGMRAVMGVGTNRINAYTIKKATMGVCEYLLSKLNYNNGKAIKVAVCFDTRNNSKEFAQLTASVFASFGIKVFIYNSAMPIALLSFALRQLKCDMGIMITASHNPKEYNGYKVYGNDGSQLTDKPSNELIYYVNKVNNYFDYKMLDYEDYLMGKEDNNSLIEEIPLKMLNTYIKETQSLRVYKGNNIKIVYTPLHGAGAGPVSVILDERLSGYNFNVVEEQFSPDGNFPTCPYPNPEEVSNFELALKKAKEIDADIILATDPDCDRVSAMVKHHNEYKFLNGNAMGVILLEYLLQNNKKLTENSVVIKSIVSTNMAQAICKKYNVKLINVLTGFKYIGEQILNLEKEQKEQDFIFGFEESCGYLNGTLVRDKDAVNACMHICDACAYYKAQGKNLYQVLQDKFNEYGYYSSGVKSFEFKGVLGKKLMQEKLTQLRNNHFKILGGQVVDGINDYLLGVNNLPRTDMLEYVLGESRVILRPSGTEPKLKIYLLLKSDNKEDAQLIEEKILKELKEIIF